MSYHDEFQGLWRRLNDASAFSHNMEMLNVKVEVPHEWFVKHGLDPIGRQFPDRMTWLLSAEDVWSLWRDADPTVRWKEVY